MISTEMRYSGKNTCVRVIYNDMHDLARQADTSPSAKSYRKGVPTKWAGGTYTEFKKYASGAPNEYTERANKYLSRFTNVAIETLGNEMEYNSIYGVLDMEAFENGEIDCLYGPEIIETESAPIKMYMDVWISSTVSAKAIEMRGVAMLALLQALSIHRPVMLEMVAAHGYTPTHTDVIQTVPVPTSNVSLAAWMVASPLFVRQGYMSMVYHHGTGGSAKPAHCGMPPLSGGRKWQSTQLGNWLASNEGVRDVVFLPMMFDNGKWLSEEYAIWWIKDNIRRLIGQDMGSNPMTLLQEKLKG